MQARTPASGGYRARLDDAGPDGAGFRLEQQRRPDVRDIPVLCLSARHDAMQPAERLGMRGVLPEAG